MHLPQRIAALLRPNEVRVVRRPAFAPWRAGVVRVRSVANGDQGENWRASVDTLGDILAESGAKGTLHVVVADQFLRYALIPWSANLVTDAERLAFARLAFIDTYGSLAERWEVALDQQPAGRSSFACAMDREMLQGLRETAARRGVRLQSVQAALAERITRHRRAFKHVAFCLASLEPGRLTFAFHGEAGWIAVRGRRLEGSLADALPGAIKQEAVAAGAPEGGSLYLIGENLADLPPFGVPGWGITRINEPSSYADLSPAAQMARMVAAK